MFPDYAGTVLWLGDPVAYGSSGLTDGLIRDLKAWEQCYYDALTPDLEWRSAELARQYTEEGNQLAARVADELGDGYEVEFRSFEPGAGRRRFHGTGAALNARAAAAFAELAATLKAEQEQSGGDDGYAFAPVSGNIFKPPRGRVDRGSES
ncbi:hypothetical protein GCM10022261_01420 [Brevibacterium daeguense]|uniref:Uncharacterized protein n=2 Tax=Brevibacterium daeguense TaxID=909936 RepID=A0ABP8EF68_9MICO